MKKFILFVLCVLLTSCASSAKSDTSTPSTTTSESFSEITTASSFEDTSATDESSEITTTQATTATQNTPVADEPTSENQRLYLDYNYPIVESQLFVELPKEDFTYEKWKIPYKRIAEDLIYKASNLITMNPYVKTTIYTSDEIKYNEENGFYYCEVLDFRFPDMEALENEYYSVVSRSSGLTLDEHYTEIDGKLCRIYYEWVTPLGGMNEDYQICDIKNNTESEFTAVVRIWRRADTYDEYAGEASFPEDKWFWNILGKKSCEQYIDKEILDRSMSAGANLIGLPSFMGYTYWLTEADFILEEDGWKFKSHPLIIDGL